MTTATKCWSAAAAAAFAMVLGCGGYGKVNQGQVVAYDGARGVMVVVQDSNYRDAAHPRFDVLPALTVRIPADKREMGPVPESGKLLSVDLDRSHIVLFDPASGGFRTAGFRLVNRQDNVSSDDRRLAGARYPRVDRAQRTVTLHLPKQRRIVTIAVAGELLDLPADTWRAGDEVRYYYRDPGQALRLMNITKTDVNKSSK